MMSTCGEEVALVTAETFGQQANGLLKRLVDKNRAEDKLCIVPELFYAVRSIHNARYLLVDATVETKALMKPGENILQFL